MNCPVIHSPCYYRRHLPDAKYANVISPGHMYILPSALASPSVDLMINFMADIQHESSKAHERDDDAFSFEAMETSQEKAMMGEERPLTPSDSPADFLFANGHLLPHAFHPPPDSFRKSISKASLTSSSSKGSSNSSRSNSTGGNSQLDTDSKFSSDFAEKEVTPVKPVIKHVRFRSRDDIAPSPPRWHFKLSPRRESSAELSPRCRVANGKERQDRRRMNPQHTNRSSGTSSAGCGIFRSFVSACRECHALEPSMQAQIRRAPPHTMASSRVQSPVSALCLTGN